MPVRKVVDPSDAQKQRLAEAIGREAAHELKDLGFKVKGCNYTGTERGLGCLFCGRLKDERLTIK
jgi:hypothetical protein